MKDGIIVKPAPFAGRPGWGMRLFSGLAASRRLSASGVLGVAFVVIVGTGTLLAPLFTPFDPLALGADTLQAPGWPHPFGTDDLGRDVLARVLYGGRVSLSVGLFSAVLSLAVMGMVRDRPPLGVPTCPSHSERFTWSSERRKSMSLHSSAIISPVRSPASPPSSTAISAR